MAAPSTEPSEERVPGDRECWMVPMGIDLEQRNEDERARMHLGMR
jgi:hypothetical protein